MKLWKAEQKISHKGILLVAVPLALNLVILGALAYLLSQQEQETERETRAKMFQLMSSAYVRTFIEAGVTTFSAILRENPAGLEKYQQLHQYNADVYKQLKEIKKNDLDQSQRLALMHRLATRSFKIFDAGFTALESGRNAQLLMQQVAIKDELQAMIREFILENEQMLTVERERQKRYQQFGSIWKVALRILIGAGIVADVALSVSLAVFFGRSIASRLKGVMDNTRRLASDRELLPAMTGNDEIAVLDNVYHTMASALKESRRRERAFVENALDVICTFDDKFTFTTVSPASNQIWGYNPDELVGKPLSEITHPDDVESTLFSTPDEDSRETALAFENRVQHKSGATISMLWSAYWSADERTYFCVGHDITARKAAENLLKESESRIRTIVENMPVGLLIIDEQGYIDATNKMLEVMLARSYDELLGHHLYGIITGESESEGRLMQALRVKFFQRVGETSCVRGDGAHLPVEFSLNGFFFRGERKYLAILVDITERHQIEQAREELINMVSHDLRTPLNSVQATMALLLNENLGELDREDARKIQRSEQDLHRLLAMINGLLDLEKMRAGMLELNREVNSLHEVARRAVDASATLADEHGVELVNETHDCELLCDGERLVQVMLQLIMDAIRRSSSADRVVISNAELDNLAEVKVATARTANSKKSSAGKQADPPDAMLAPNTGLGLAICTGIIAAHKGSLGVNVDEQNDWVSWFRIPLPED